MVGFTTKLDLFQTSIFIKELKVKHFKILLKTLLGDEPSPEDTFYNFINILSELTSLDKEELKNLSVIDFLIIIIFIRSISIGGSIQLEILDKKNTKLELNLSRVIDNLKKGYLFNFKYVINDIEIVLKYPSVKNFLLSTKDENNFLNIKDYIHTFSIKDGKTLNISNLTDRIFLQVFEALPATYSAKIIKEVYKLKQYLYQINLLQHLADENLSLYLTPNSFIFIFQLLFSKNLFPLYENIFALAKFANFSPEYIEECTPGEYTIFIKILERVLKEQNTQQTTNILLPPINSDNPEFM
jgi:hypothetical protein